MRKTIPKAVQESPFMTECTRVVPIDVWQACWQLYGAAATLRMPVENPEMQKIGIGDKVYAFTDRPENRGMFAVKEFLGRDQRDLFASVAMRLLLAFEALRRIKNAKRFERFFKKDPSGDWMISEALLGAFATVEISRRKPRFNLPDLYRTAVKLDD